MQRSDWLTGQVFEIRLVPPPRCQKEVVARRTTGAASWGGWLPLPKD